MTRAGTDSPRDVRSVGIAGLGLIGGSLAHDLAALGITVLGHDADPDTLAKALHSGVVTRPLGPHLEHLAEVDILIIAVPVSAATDWLAAAAASEAHPAITDVCSTKRSMEAAALRCGLGPRFVGSHPLTGDHRAGWSAARAGLFRGRSVYICTTTQTESAAVRAVISLWRAAGAEPTAVTAAAHDRLVARTSHLPQATASALATWLQNAGIARSELGPGGRDATRLAASPADLWTGIALDNADELAAALAGLGGTLDELRAALERGDEAAVRAFFDAAGAWAL